jgi:hypothetical protein
MPISLPAGTAYLNTARGVAQEVTAFPATAGRSRVSMLDVTGPEVRTPLVSNERYEWVQQGASDLFDVSAAGHYFPRFERQNDDRTRIFGAALEVVGRLP